MSTYRNPRWLARPAAIELEARRGWALAALTLTFLVTFTGHTGAVAAAQPLPAAQHWGSFDGDKAKGDQDTTLSPAAVTIPDPSPVVQAGTSNSTGYALLADGTVWAWGQGTNGQLGNGTTQNSLTTAVQVQFPAGVAIAFLATNSMPYNTALAVDTTGQAWGWGDNGNGELCTGSAAQYDAPQQLPLTGVTALAGASGHALYVSGGTVYECGANGSGVAGIGTMRTHGSLTPTPITALDGAGVTHVFASYQDDAALTASGVWYDWGLNQDGQLGDGGTANSDVPLQVSLQAPVSFAALGGSEPYNGQTVVALADGTYWSWGSDAYGQVLGATSTAQVTPLEFAPPVTFTALASGEGSEYGVDAGGGVWAWGENDFGQCGNGTRATVTSPVQVITSGMTAVSATARDAVSVP